jgi:hypothetical protein
MASLVGAATRPVERGIAGTLMTKKPAELFSGIGAAG